MTSRKFLKELERNSAEPFQFWGFLISLTSLFYGYFIINTPGFLLNHVEPYFQGIPEWVFGYGLLLFGMIKLTGVFTKNKRIRKTGIIALSAIWSALFILAFTYSFGTGYPHPSWIFSLSAVLTCWRISFKGDFNGD